MLTLALLFALASAFCNTDSSFSRAVYRGQFKKVERIIKRIVRKNRDAYIIQNRETEKTIQFSFYSNYERIVNWLKKQECVADAFWDKCQAKEAIYPGHSTIGVRFKTKKGLIEKCFLIQEGTTGQVNILGWRPKLLQSKRVLVYNKMYDCEKFIELQRSICETKKTK